MTNWVEKELIKFLRAIAKRVKKDFCIHYKSLNPMVPSDAFYSDPDEEIAGSCTEDGDIRIKLRKENGKFRSIEFLIDTVLHELAHAACDKTHFHKERPAHPQEWRSAYRRLKKWFRQYE